MPSHHLPELWQGLLGRLRSARRAGARRGAQEPTVLLPARDQAGRRLLVLPPLRPLTFTLAEREVPDLIARDRTNPAIARQLP